jgi:hypothetical protein
MKIIKLSIAIAFCFLLTSGNHPFYVSTTEIEFNPKTKEIGIAFKTFPDDLEETLRGFSGKKLDLAKKTTQRTINLLRPISKNTFRSI